MEGTLSKWTNVMKGWQYRFFVLDEKIGILSYYTSKEKMMKGVRRGCVRLKGAVIGIDDQDVTTFTITVDHKTFHFQARDADEREKWVRRLEDTILRHANRRAAWDQPYVQNNSISQGTPGSTIGNNKRNHLLLFDRKVSEADAYLQLMIEQTEKIEKRISNISDVEDKNKFKSIQDHANAMLDNVKHSIVLLQIAKNTAHPINGIYQGPGTSKTATSITEPAATPQSIQTNIELASECIENRQQTAELAINVPETSYSSSEGEDDFYDANDDMQSPYQANTPTNNVRNLPETVSRLSDDPYITADDNSSSQSLKQKRISIDNKPSLAAHSESQLVETKPIPIRNDGSLDYDALYDDDDESNISMESHGSVVTHLLSQVKIGMDLTKVVLPTFILERRSLLEMYADYFAHPDLFLKIADLKDPKERMVQVVRWYLSVYHAGRKSAVAKKPYNPILGEIFQCHWDIPEYASDHVKIVEDGPIPWCRSDQLTFIAEQVSHHPPISAFYAEHYNKKISFMAHVWTKSKFLGLSIGVHNIGQGIVTVCDHNEEYILTFPNGYGRSILTIPWIELGGTVSITCAKTGYHADIDFLTKPFYGGKRNKITGEVYAPNEKKSFLSIYGEWSGLMEAKWNDGSRSQPEVFVDVNSIPIFKKKVRPIVEQTEHESRKIWRDVTAGLKINDIDKATSAKFIIEQRQREEAKTRKDTNQDWGLRFFKSVGEAAWVYNKPLTHRLTLEQHDNKR